MTGIIKYEHMRTSVAIKLHGTYLQATLEVASNFMGQEKRTAGRKQDNGN